MAQTSTFYAHSFDANGNYWCVLDGNHHIVSEYTDMTRREAHALAAEMNDDADEARLQAAE